MKTLLLYLLFQTTFFTKVYAVSCTSLTNVNISEDHVLSVVLDAERVILELSKMYQTHPEMTKTISETYELLASNIERSLAFDFSDPDQLKSFLRFEQRVNTIGKNTVLYVESAHQISKESKLKFHEVEISKKLTWSESYKSPTSIEPERTYSVVRHDGTTVKILFSKKVVEKIFHSKDVFYVKAVKKALSAISSVGHTGLIKIAEQSDIYEIKHVGATGSFRLFAYLDNGIFHIVHWSNESKHTVSTVRRSVDKTRAAQLKRSR